MSQVSRKYLKDTYSYDKMLEKKVKEAIWSAQFQVCGALLSFVLGTLLERYNLAPNVGR